MFLPYLVLVIVATVARWPSFSFPLTEAYAFRQTQTTLMIREFMESGVFQLSPLPLFGPGQAVPLEFPLFQQISALLGNLVATTPQLAGRFTAYGFFILSGLLLAFFITKLYGHAPALIAFALYVFLPFGFQWGNAPLIESAAYFFALVALAGLLLWIQRKKAWWLLIFVGLMGSFLIKPTTAVVWVVPFLAVVFFWETKENSSLDIARRVIATVRKRWIALALVTVAILSGLGWTWLSDSIKSQSPYTQFLTSSSLTEWNYGSIDQRLDSALWFQISTYGEAIYGSIIVLFILGVIAIAFSPQPVVTAAFLSTVVIAPLIFFNLYFMHSYYLNAVYAPMVLVLGVGIGAIARAVRPKDRGVLVGVVSTLSILILAWISPEGRLVSQRSVEGLYQFPLAQELVAHTPEESGIALIGCDWDPTYFYLSGRSGLMLRNEDQELGIPAEWIGDEIEFIGRCNPDLDPAVVLPPNAKLVQVSEHVWKIFN